MEKTLVIHKDFASVPCGRRLVQTVKIENTTKEVQVLVVRERHRDGQILTSRLQIQPQTITAQPKQTVTFKLIYMSGVEGIVDNFYYDISNSMQLVAQLFIRGHSVGPALTSTVFNVNFFRFRDVNQTVKKIEMANTGEQDAVFYFDIDEDYKKIEISHRRGVIPAKTRLILTLTFVPTETEVYLKKFFCLVQHHEPIIFNVLAVSNPKLKLDPRNISFRHLKEQVYTSGYEAYTNRDKSVKAPEKMAGDKFLCKEKSLENFELDDVPNAEELEEVKLCWTRSPSPSYHSEPKPEWEIIFLTKRFIDIGNSPETPNATNLVNLSGDELFCYEWDHDPKDNFQISPCRGLINPNTKIDFTINFTPSSSECLYHVEMDLKVFLSKVESPDDSSQTIIHLPLTFSLRICGHSFPDDSCGWVSQCQITPKVLYLQSCVPGETVYGTFRLDREGHLPVNFAVIPSKEPSFTVSPYLGHLSKDFRLFTVQFNSYLKEPGVYTEDLKIKFNKSDLDVETIKIVASVEIPLIIFGADNSISFPAVFPGSRASDTITMENLTNLFLNYELQIPEDIDWIEIVNATGLIEPRAVNEIEIIFKPLSPDEYLDYIPCVYSSPTKPDFTQTVHLQVIGSCQYGYLVATPSICDFGKCVYKKKSTHQVHLFNFSSVILYFRLMVTDMNCLHGDPVNDIIITPDKGMVPAKGSLEITITVIAHQIETLMYDIECQHFRDDSENSEPCESPRKIISVKFEGVLSTFQIVDLNVINAGPLFSPHWLWKMLCINDVNKALRSVKPETELRVKFPEAMQYCEPIILGLVLEATQYSPVTWEAKIEIKSPCLEASLDRVVIVECLHIEETPLPPTKYKLEPSERMLFPITIYYDLTNESQIFVTFKFPGKREVILRMPLVSLSRKSYTTASLYLNQIFHLKPIFLGDPQPPVQLFWLYNNRNSPASYSADILASRDDLYHEVFECLNPEGIIQPFSMWPLQIVFRPREIIEYTTELNVIFEKQMRSITLIGEGVLNISSIREIGTEKTIPEKPNLRVEDIMLECCQNFVNINFIRVFSRTKRVFYMKNLSETDKWYFSWQSFNFDNLFSVKIIPPRGILKPGQKELMSLFFESYCYPTYVSISIPCEVVNYSAKKAFENGTLLRSIMAENDKDYFTITEKGITYKDTGVTVPPEPPKFNIFITLNANIISNLSIGQKLNKRQQSMLRTEKEITRNMNLRMPLKPRELALIQGLLENILWDILCSTDFVPKTKNLQKPQDFIYQQLLPQTLKRREELGKYFMMLPQKYLIQRVLESTVESFCEKFTSKKKGKL